MNSASPCRCFQASLPVCRSRQCSSADSGGVRNTWPSAMTAALSSQRSLARTTWRLHLSSATCCASPPATAARADSDTPRRIRASPRRSRSPRRPPSGRPGCRRRTTALRRPVGGPDRARCLAPGRQAAAAIALARSPDRARADRSRCESRPSRTACCRSPAARRERTRHPAAAGA